MMSGDTGDLIFSKMSIPNKSTPAKPLIYNSTTTEDCDMVSPKLHNKTESQIFTDSTTLRLEESSPLADTLVERKSDQNVIHNEAYEEKEKISSNCVENVKKRPESLLLDKTICKADTINTKLSKTKKNSITKLVQRLKNLFKF